MLKLCRNPESCLGLKEIPAFPLTRSTPRFRPTLQFLSPFWKKRMKRLFIYWPILCMKILDKIEWKCQYSYNIALNVMFVILHTLFFIIYRFYSNFVEIWTQRCNFALKSTYKKLTRNKKNFRPTDPNIFRHVSGNRGIFRPYWITLAWNYVFSSLFTCHFKWFTFCGSNIWYDFPGVRFI